MSTVRDLIQELRNDTSNAKEITEKLDALPIKTKGVSQDELELLIDLVVNAKSGLTIGIRTHILRSYLYFKGPVRTSVVYKICASLGVKVKAKDRKLPHTLQASLVNWLICVYPFFEEPDVIERLYGLLFNYLEFEYLRPAVANLLFLATKKKHVTQTKIQRLIGLYMKNTQSRYIIALALLYKEYVPTEMLENFPRISYNVFKHPNPVYQDQLSRLRKTTDTSTQLQKANIELKKFEDFGGKLKKRKINTLNIDFSTSYNISHSDSITSAHQFIGTIDNLEIPKDWNSVLGDNLQFSMYALMLKGSRIHFKKLNTWISMTLDDFPNMKSNHKMGFLDLVKNYVDLSLTVPDAIIEDFLMNESIVAEESSLTGYIWYFISKLNFKNINDIEVLVSLYLKLMDFKKVQWCSRYIESVANLLQNCLSLEEDLDSTKVSALFDIFQRHVLAVSSKIVDLKYDRQFVLSVLQMIKSLQHVPQEHLTPAIVVLPPPLVFTLLMLDDPIAISEICLHLNFCKDVLKVAETTDEITNLTNLHNSYVIDICNIIWRNKAFDIGKSSSSAMGLTHDFTNAFSDNVPIFDRNTTFKSLFNIHHSPAFASYSATLLRKFEDQNADCDIRHEGPLSSTSVQELLEDEELNWLQTSYEDIRVEILKELEKLGYVGLADLLFSHLKSLLNKR